MSSSAVFYTFTSKKLEMLHMVHALLRDASPTHSEIEQVLNSQSTNWYVLGGKMRKLREHTQTYTH